jgi:hypothetical protein
VEREGDGEVEGVVCGFVDHDETVSGRIDVGGRDGELRKKATYFSSENLLRSTLSSGAVIKSISCPISVWYVVCEAT